MSRQSQKRVIGPRIAALSEAEGGLEGEGGRERFDETGRKKVALDSSGLFEVIGVGGAKGGEASGQVIAFPSIEVEGGEGLALFEEETTRRLTSPMWSLARFRLERFAVECG
ncbi:MAG TPA: hypothetical protein PLA50_08295, partial [Bacteroidia bacterium]|nr:hypothetical protein [Bacteroidia bacterium]